MEKFKQFLISCKKSSLTQKRYIKIFEEYLNYYDDIAFDNIEIYCFLDYLEFKIDKKKHTQYLWALKTYFEHMDKQAEIDEVNYHIGVLYQANMSVNTLEEIIDPNMYDKLKASGIRKLSELDKVLNQSDEYEQDELNILYRIYQLTKIQGVSKVRLLLYLNSGFDSLEKLAEEEKHALRIKLKEYINKSNFSGVAPTIKELDTTIRSAKYILTRQVKVKL